MTRNPFVATGHGYETGSQGRCTAFDRFDIIAAPLGDFDAAGRESRILGRIDGRQGTGCDYGSHVIKLAVEKNARLYKGGRELFILMHNGSGREVLRMPQMYDGGALEPAILAMPETLQYALLYSIWTTASEARDAAREQADSKWAQAFADGRIRKSRPKGGRFRVHVESEFERDMRLGRVQPARVAIDVATGEATAA